jgi:hypothetical protein
MYKIYLDDYPIYDLRDKEYIVASPQLDLEINKVGTLKFKIYNNHPYFDNIEKLSSVLTVLKGDKVVFKGRVISDEQGLYNDKNIECEGVLGYLNDSIVRPYSFQGTPAEHFTNLIDSHNSQVAEHQQLKIGLITVTDQNDYITRSSIKYDTTWKILNEDLIEKLGGYLKIRYEQDGTYIDYLADFEDTSTQVIELGENLIDVLVKNDAADVYTVVIPLGAEIEKEDGTKTRLTIESVNGGKDYLVNQEAYNKYGWIVAPIDDTTFDDVTIANNLKTKGQTFLDNDAVMLKSSIEVKAVDLNVTDANIEAFFIYEYVRFVSQIHNLNQIYLLNKISIPLSEPEKTEITLGKEESSLTGIQMGNGSKLDNVINRVNIVESNYTINNEKLNDIEKTIEYFSVDLAQYNITIPTDNNKVPLETKNYDINFYAYYKGGQVVPNVSISGSNTGITTSKTNDYISFVVLNDTAIPNILNEYTITFTYTADGTTYTLNKKIDIAIVLNGADGTSVNILGSYDTLGALQTAHPTGNVGDAYIVQGDLYVWCVETSSWENVGRIQGQTGADGKSSYLHIRYSDDGTTFTDNDGITVGRYRGELVNNNPVASTTFEDYTWYDMALVVEDELNSIREEVQTNLTSIQQNQEEIVLTALQEYVKTSNFEEFKETVSTMITQTNEDITFSFNTLTSIVSTMDQEIQQQFQEQSKYIRFDGGISLGELGNEVTLRIENDVIKFVVSNLSVLEITPNGIVAPKIKTNEVEFTPFRLFVEEDGSLTLDMVGDDA